MKSVKNKEGTLVFYYDTNLIIAQSQMENFISYLEEIKVDETNWIILPNGIRVEFIGNNQYKLYYLLEDIKRGKAINYESINNK